MKTLKTIATVSLGIFLASCAKDNTKINTLTLPDEVKGAFKSQNSNVNNVEWEKDGKYYIAEYEKDGFEKEVVYDANGNIISTETELNVSNLLPAITNYISQNYSGYSIKEAEKEETKEGEFYEVELKNGSLHIEIVFDSKGNFIEQEAEDEDDDDGENEREISTDIIPQPVKDNIASQYPGAKLLEADEITIPDGSITYDVEIESNGNITELMYDAQGNFLGVETDDDDADDEHDD
jgi:uncharacterized membrane protein YkoI